MAPISLIRAPVRRMRDFDPPGKSAYQSWTSGEGGRGARRDLERERRDIIRQGFSANGGGESGMLLAPDGAIGVIRAREGGANVTIGSTWGDGWFRFEFW